MGAGTNACFLEMPAPRTSLLWFCDQALLAVPLKLQAPSKSASLGYIFGLNEHSAWLVWEKIDGAFPQRFQAPVLDSSYLF